MNRAGRDLTDWRCNANHTAIMGDKGPGHNGIGAVMGSKKLKAVVVSFLTLLWQFLETKVVLLQVKSYGLLMEIPEEMSGELTLPVA